MNITVFQRSLHGGGAERVMTILANEFVRKGHSVDMVLMMKKGEYTNEVRENVRLVGFGCSHPWSSLMPLVRYLSDEKPDIILSALPIANSISSISTSISLIDTRVVLTEHSSQSLIFGDLSNKRQIITLPLARIAYKMADQVVCVSEGVEKKMERIRMVSSEKVSVVNNPIRIDEIRRKKETCTDLSWFEKESIPTVISAGRMTESKNFDSLIRSFRTVKNKLEAKLIILGKGEKKKDLESIVSILDLERDVVMPGFVENPWKYIAKADVFVLPSKYEGFGNVLVEAMACGTPVVSTDCPTGPRMILADGQYGKLVPVGDTEAMASAILETLRSPSESQSLVDRAYDFSATKSAEQYLHIMRGANGQTGTRYPPENQV